MTSSPVFLSIKNAVAYNLQRIRIIEDSEFHSQNRIFFTLAAPV